MKGRIIIVDHSTKVLILDKVRVANGGTPIDVYLIQNEFGNIDTVSPNRIKEVLPITEKWNK